MSDRPATRVWEAAAAANWAILPERLPAIFEIAAREHEPDFAAIAAQLGRPLENARAATVRDGVAIVPIEGVIFPRASLFTAISGGVSINTLAADFSAALANPEVSSIAFLVDSPGGDTNGVAELAAMIYAARDRKPSVAYVRDLGASAAYWLAAAAGEVVIATTALVGSIGIIGIVSAPGQNSRTLEVVSSQSPHKRTDPTSRAGQARIHAQIDTLAAIFIEDVARYRGVSPSTVESDFGQGDVLLGQAAVDAKMADRVGSFEGVVAELQQRAREPRRIDTTGRTAARGGSMAQQQPQGRMERFMAWIGGAGDDSAFAGATIAASGPLPLASPGNGFAGGTNATVLPVTLSTTPDPEVARLREQVAALEAEKRTALAARLDGEATAFAERFIAGGRALPVEQGHLAALYRLAASDDAAHGPVTASDGTQTTRVAALTAWQEARPTSGHLGELVPVKAGDDGSLTVLGNQEKTAFAGAKRDDPLTEEEKIRLMALTPTGRAELKRRGIAIPVAAQQ